MKHTEKTNERYLQRWCPDCIQSWQSELTELFINQIRSVEERDVERLSIILESWVVDDENWDILFVEVESILNQILNSINWNKQRKYIVAVDTDNNPIWIIWMKSRNSIDGTMSLFTNSDRPVELINFFVSKEFKWTWIWKTLLNGLIEYAKSVDATEIVVNSWPRYQSSWWFYDKHFERVWVARDYYWKWVDATVWRMILKKS